MLKMKIEPAMCMKTKETMTKCPVKNTAFTRECTNCTLIDDNLAGLLAENAHKLHEKSGRRRSQNRLIGPSAHRPIGSSAHRKSTELVLDGPMAKTVVSGERQVKNSAWNRITDLRSQIGDGKVANQQSKIGNRKWPDGPTALSSRLSIMCQKKKGLVV